jgi:alpha-L-fucosidase 2
MIAKRIVLAIVGGCLLCFHAMAQSWQAPERGFTSWQPAPNWEHALLSGNGEMGALVFGHPHEETIILSHAELYLPREMSDSLIDQAAHLEEIRSLIENGNYEEATKIPVQLRKESGYDDERDPFIPAFDIKITQEAANISEYVRATNFATGEAITHWQDDVGTFERKLFVSRADSVIALSITADAPINCTIRFTNRPVEWNQWGYINEHVEFMHSGAEEGWLTYESAFKKNNRYGLEGVNGAGKLLLEGGSASVEGNGLKIQGAKEVLLLVKIMPDFRDKPSDIASVKKYLNKQSDSYETLLDAHEQVHGKIFNRVSLDLKANADNKAMHSEEMILKAKQKEEFPALVEKAFDASRYNILSSTGVNPPNLQGIWTGTWTAPWSSGFTHDGNLPSAMSVVMPGNMPELMDAYVSYHEGNMQDYQMNAKRLFGIDGINLPGHTTTNGWPTDFNETWCLTLWTAGAGWAADIFYDYYRYTGDMEYLKNHAYPWIKQSAAFYESFLVEDENGTYQFNPSYSPENNPKNQKSQAVINATMDVMVAKQTLRSAIEAGKLVGEDKAKLRQWEELLANMPAYTVNEEGVLKEWISSEYKENYRHRHVSQLYSLYNHMDEDILKSPALQEGAINLLDKKLAFRNDEGGGEMSFGLVQLGLSAVHLHQPEKAYDAVKWLASRYWSTGFGSFHNVGHLLNTDISGGLPAVIIHMLAFSENGTIYLLPALPETWADGGSLKGALLRNQITLSALSWNKEEVVVKLTSAIDQKQRVKLPFSWTAISGSNNVIKQENKADGTFQITLKAGKEATITIKR